MLRFLLWGLQGVWAKAWARHADLTSMSDNRANPKSTIKIEDVYFYFDGVERDRLDASGMSRRSGEVLALRERLLRLPEAEFDVVIRTLRQVISESSDDVGTKPQGQQRARVLYDKVRTFGGASAASTKVSPA